MLRACLAICLQNAGLGIQSSVFQAIRSLFVSRRAIRSWKRAIRSWKRAICSCHSFVLCNLSKSPTVPLLSWATWVNRSRLLFLKSDGSQSLKSFFKKEVMSKEWWEWFAFVYNKGENCQKHMKNTNFSSESLVFYEGFAQIMSE